MVSVQVTAMPPRSAYSAAVLCTLYSIALCYLSLHWIALWQRAEGALQIIDIFSYKKKEQILIIETNIKDTNKWKHTAIYWAEQLGNTNKEKWL